jgi:hypothetical protein
MLTTERVYAAGVTEMPRLDGSSEATWWNRVKDGSIASFRDGGRTKIVIDWVNGEKPPGSPPSYREYVAARLGADIPKRHMPRGVHRGRPRLRPLPAAE